MFTLIDFGGFAKAASVTPTKIEGPHDPEFEGLTAIKLEPKGDSFEDKKYELLGGAIKVTISNNGTIANFESAIPISKVYVKGGNNKDSGDKYFGYLFEYEPPVKSDTNLYALVNQNGNPMGISHIVFYYKKPVLETYEISITKQIKEDGKVRDWKEGDEEFTFTIKLKGNQEAVEITKTTVKGVAHFENLAAGVYEVTEAPRDGYKVDYNGNKEITVGGEETNFTIINEKEKEVPKTYDISITKQIKEDGKVRDWKEGEEEFTFTIKLKGNPEAVGITKTTVKGVAHFENLAAGVYEVTEAPEKGYKVDYNGNKEITVGGEQTNFTIINEKEKEVPKTYDISIIKQIKEDGKVRAWKEGDEEFTFTIKLKGNPEAAKITKTTVKGVAHFDDLAAGVYEVTEAPEEGYKIDYNGNKEITVGGEQTNFIIINEKEEHENPVGSIKIVKTVKVGDKSPVKPGDVEFTFNLLKDGKVFKTGKTDSEGILTFDNLPIGEYVLEEVASDKYTTSLNSTNNKIIVKKNETTTVEVVNTLKQTDEDKDDDEDEDLPHTGGFAEEEILFALAGAFIILLGIRLRRVRQ